MKKKMGCCCFGDLLRGLVVAWLESDSISWFQVWGFDVGV